MDSGATVEHELIVPARVVAGIERMTGRCDTTPTVVFLAAHAKVASVLAGERDVVIGCRLPGAPRIDKPHRLRVRVSEGSWVALLAALPDLRSTEPDGRAYDTVLDLSRAEAGSGQDPAGGKRDTPLDAARRRVSFIWDEASLRLRCAAPVADATTAERLAGYHLAALDAMVSDPDAAHHEANLLSADELGLLRDGFAGPVRPVPNAPFHELFEARVRMHPDAVAAVCGDRQWTYAEVNRCANRIGHALLARGVCGQDVVAVAAERGVEWLVATLAVLKTGACYLPMEPQFPTERLGAMLTRGDVRLVLADTAGQAAMTPLVAGRAVGLGGGGVAGVLVVPIDGAIAEARGDSDLGVWVDGEHRAYVYFTSGSTGEPKGAVCAHAGMVNHLYAKVEDLGIGVGTVVAQTAPQCFDISLWQLFGALLVGGRVVIVPQDAVIDVARFVGTIAAHRVEVLQLVPSYLDVMLTYLDSNPVALPALRCLSATGEALKGELARRWFARFPGAALVNAYGLTETSDDTNHEVMTRAPDGPVPLGRPIRNVRVYVLDERLSLAPIGAPGEIAFSGVCVGLGYLNDPERTAAAFVPDPYRPGERMYRSGDFGRWRPDGKLEFLGRRDAQIKLRGFRIELGEIEDRLLRMVGIRDAAVVVIAVDAGETLTAFYTGERLVTETIRQFLAAALPDYMVPARLHWTPALPLTANGKVDRKALARRAGELSLPSADPPRTPAELRLAAAWADALGIAPRRIGRGDHFFDSGGTSLSAVRLAIRLDGQVTLRDIGDHPVFADLAVHLANPVVEVDGA